MVNSVVPPRSTEKYTNVMNNQLLCYLGAVVMSLGRFANENKSIPATKKNNEAEKGRFW